ncbi:hypothetical protein [Halocatena pleomorpha]|uniref:Uncharacterized protein n=1 Tax=Halocatena pleomorpha TaxID=1785090 RepID=A0A3P3RDX7_9EURY|nr:hypothetical protein [Halocatena pleomorpha]RRJ31158.1 hypothetical protein EIK79_07955 [Halocatena pleomorpha]
MSDRYAPSQAARLLGGIQWASTALVIGSAAASVYIDYRLGTTPDSTGGTISFTTEMYIVLSLSFALGYLWVRYRMKNKIQEARGFRQRIDYVFLLWLGWPVVYAVLSKVCAVLRVDLTPTPYLTHIVFCLGDIVFSVIVIYWFQVDLASRFLSD